MKIIYCLLAFFLCQSLYALNQSFLYYSPIYYFQDRDAKLMSQNAVKVLNHYPNGKKSFWKNARTPAFGYAVVTSTNYQHGKLCKDLTIFNSAKGVTDKAHFYLCKFNHSWKIVK